ncbi:MAG: hypothetical protein ACK40G_09360 [Cytophagaceae bacterium]
MSKRISLSAFLLLFGLSSLVNAQTNFYLSGLGRALVTNDKLEGKILEGDTTSARRGVGGYTLFDLKSNLDVNKNFHGNAIVRVRNDFGAFWGLSNVFTVRQVQLMGTIRDVIKYEIGDINVGMTPYTVYNPNEIYHKYESDLFRQRREILEYENFIFDNQWRLQGAQANTAYKYDRIIEKVGLKAFGTRTNPTNDATIPDRVLAGVNLDVTQSKLFRIGFNYVGLLDIPIQTALVNYQNEVYTTDGRVTLENEKTKVELFGEGGFSNYKFEESFGQKSVSSYNDFFFDLGLSGTYKPANAKLFVSYKDVGPQFSSPSAQTRRLDIRRTPMLFDMIGNATTPREQVLFDRFTQEQIYLRGISPVLLPFLPQYNNINPYGAATPNRRGITAGVSASLPSKVIDAEVITDMQKEIVGEGNESLRNFFGVRGGLRFNLDRLLKWENKIGLNAGIRQENTTRSGTAQIDFKSTLIDFGAHAEVIKNVDLLVGLKRLNASGNEYLALRDQFNVPYDFPAYNLNMVENILSFGGRIRFSEKSYFTLNYNLVEIDNKLTTGSSYKMNQLFANYTVIF